MTVELAETFKTLGNPLRLAIIQYLVSSPESRTGVEIAAHLGESGPTISKHLEKLQRSGVVKVGYLGRYNLYVIEPSAYLEIIEQINSLFLGVGHETS